MSADIGPVEYATTADGVSIAYQRFGQGRPILCCPLVPLLLRVRQYGAHVGTLAALSPTASTVVWDPRGMGMSDRSVADFSMEAWLADAVAVADAVGGPLPVYGSALQGPIALAPAARRPDLVST